jgi:CsoR family transcriptional regulator, copper-sensing transcriptional repressor
MKESIKRGSLRRLKIIEGQVRGLQKMVENEAYCIDIITQSLAVKQALSGVEDLILKNHLGTHVVEQIRAGNSAKPQREILRIYELAKRK